MLIKYVVDHSDQKFLSMRCNQLVTREQALRPRPTRTFDSAPIAMPETLVLINDEAQLRCLIGCQ
jgi:hypothetical protein